MFDPYELAGAEAAYPDLRRFGDRGLDNALGQAPGPAVRVYFQLQLAYERDDAHGDEEVDDGCCDEGEEGLEGAAAYEVAGAGEVHDGYVADDGGHFYHGDELALVDGQDVPDGLGQDDAEEARCLG